MGAINYGQLFVTSVLAFMSDLQESPLKKFCEKQTVQGGESVTFNRIKPAKSNDGVPSMYGSDGNEDAGDMVPIKVTIDEISSQDKVKHSDMMKTKIDIKSTYVRTMGVAAKLKEQSKIIAQLATLTAKVTPTKYSTECKGVQISGYESAADVKKIIAQIRKAKAMAKMTLDGHQGVALVMTTDDWATLSTSDYVLSKDYESVFGGGTSGNPTTFYGAEICLVDSDANIGGENQVAYVVPSNCICFAEWEGSLDVTAEFHKTDGMQWHLQVYKSVGVKVAEAHVITKLTKEVIS